MNCQILNIIIYGIGGQMRTINFLPNSVNIITGKSGTGKTALLHILDYCLGAEKCKVCIGVVSTNVKWYAVKFQFASGELFIARRNPEQGKESSEDIYFECGKSVTPPNSNKLNKNTNLDGLKNALSQILKLGDYSHEPNEGQTRNTGVANIRKALFYCFQEQSEIANPNFLFHRQGEPFIQQEIKDYLPYFLGAVKDKFITINKDLKTQKRNLKLVLAKNAERDRINGQSFDRAFALLNEAKSVNLIDEKEYLHKDWNIVRQQIESALSRDDCFPEEVDFLYDLIDQEHTIRDEYRKAYMALKSLKDLKHLSSEFGTEIEEQKSRLEAINIFGHDSSQSICPLCASNITNKMPPVESIVSSLRDIESQLEAFNNDSPYIDRLISEAEQNCADIKCKLEKVLTSVRSLQKTHNYISKFRDMQSKQSVIKGRLSLYLENMIEIEDSKLDIAKEVELKKKISNLEDELEINSPADELLSIISIVSTQITSLAKNLNLEHSGFPMRLDLKNSL